MDHSHVTFQYKDYRHIGKVKLLKLSKNEFIRRFSLHILPAGFTRIRHYGILSARLKPTLFPAWQKSEKKSWDTFWVERQLDVFLCPYCKNGRLLIIGEVPKRGPPGKAYIITKNYYSTT